MINTSMLTFADGNNCQKHPLPHIRRNDPVSEWHPNTLIASDQSFRHRIQEQPSTTHLEREQT